LRRNQGPKTVVDSPLSIARGACPWFVYWGYTVPPRLFSLIASTPKVLLLASQLRTCWRLLVTSRAPVVVVFSTSAASELLCCELFRKYGGFNGIAPAHAGGGCESYRCEEDFFLKETKPPRGLGVRLGYFNARLECFPASYLLPPLETPPPRTSSVP